MVRDTGLISIDLRGDLKAIRQVLAAYPAGVNKVIARTLNRTTPSVRVAAARAISRDMKLPVRLVRDSIKLGKRAYVRSLSADIRASGKRIPLIAFSARQTRAGVSYDVGQGRKVLPRAFINTSTFHGRRGVYKRIAAGDRLVGRYPIHEKYGPSIPRSFIGEAVQRVMRTTARERWERELQAQLRFFLSSKGGGGNG